MNGEWRGVVVQVVVCAGLILLALKAPETRVAIVTALGALVGAWSQRGRLVQESDLRRLTMSPPPVSEAEKPFRAPMPSHTGFTDPPNEGPGK